MKKDNSTVNTKTDAKITSSDLPLQYSSNGDSHVKADVENANATNGSGKRNKSHKSKTAMLMGGLLMVLCVGIGVVFTRKTNVVTETVTVAIDWQKDLPSVQLSLASEDTGEVKITGGLVLRKAFPYESDLSKKYFKHLRLGFDAKGFLKGTQVDVVCNAVVFPKIAFEDCFQLSVTAVEDVKVFVYDANGKELSVDTTLFVSVVKKALTGLVFKMKNVKMPVDSVRIVDDQFWLHSDGMEFRNLSCAK